MDLVFFNVISPHTGKYRQRLVIDKEGTNSHQFCGGKGVYKCKQLSNVDLMWTDFCTNVGVSNVRDTT